LFPKLYHKKVFSEPGIKLNTELNKLNEILLRLLQQAKKSWKKTRTRFCGQEKVEA